jgi:glycosyltransferase involved in cell wall biosynthesis
MTAKLSGLSYIIPVYNEQNKVVDTVDMLSRILMAMDFVYEIIVVDDGSTDDTALAINSLDIKNLVTLRHPSNGGYGAAIKSGLEVARYDWVGIIDADGSYAIEDLPKLVDKAEQGFDMVIGNRMNIKEQDFFIKRIFRYIFREIVGVLVDRKIDDINSGFRIARKSAVMEFFPFLCSTFSFTTSLTILFAERGLFISQIPTKYSSREGESKVRHLRDSLRASQMILQGVTYFNPIKIFTFISLFLVIFVCIPAMILAMLDMKTLSAYYMIFGSVVTMLFGLGILGDIVRVSAIRAGAHKFKNETIENGTFEKTNERK